MSNRSWVEVLEEQQARTRVFNPERMRAEMAWAALTGKAPDIFGKFVDVPCKPIRVEPRSPIGRGPRKPKQQRAVVVETKRSKVITTPAGIINAKRTTRQTITVRT